MAKLSFRNMTKIFSLVYCIIYIDILKVVYQRLRTFVVVVNIRKATRWSFVETGEVYDNSSFYVVHYCKHTEAAIQLNAMFFRYYCDLLYLLYVGGSGVKLK